MNIVVVAKIKMNIEVEKQELAIRGHSDLYDSLNQETFKAIFNLVIIKNPEVK